MGTVSFYMVNIDSPNIFWSRIKEIHPDKIKQMSFHDDPELCRKKEHVFHFKYIESNKRRINHWFDDPGLKYRFDAWWID